MLTHSVPFCEIPVHEVENKKRVRFEKQGTLQQEDALDVFSVLYFGQPNNRVVASGNGVVSGKILAWNSLTTERVDVHESHEGDVNDLMKMRDSIFLSCSDDRTIRRFSVKESSIEEEKVLESSAFECEIYRLLKLSEDLFLCRLVSSVLCVISFSKWKVFKKYWVGNIDAGYLSQALLLSEKHHNSFYVSVQEDGDPIKMVDFSKDLLVKEFKGGHSSMVFALSLYSSSNGEEILIVWNTKDVVSMYRTSHHESQVEIRSVIFQGEDQNDLTDYSYNSISGVKIQVCKTLGNKYQICGGRDGGIYFSEIVETSGGEVEMKRLAVASVHEQAVRKIAYSIDPGDSSRLMIFSCSLEGKVKMSKVYPVSFFSYEVEDRTERIQFLLEYVDSNPELFFKVVNSSDSFELLLPKSFFV